MSAACFWSVSLSSCNKRDGCNRTGDLQGSRVEEELWSSAIKRKFGTCGPNKGRLWVVRVGIKALLRSVVKIGGMRESSVGREGIVPTQTGGAVIARGKAGDLVSMTPLPSVWPSKLRLVIRYSRCASVSPSWEKHSPSPWCEEIVSDWDRDRTIRLKMRLMLHFRLIPRFIMSSGMLSEIITTGKRPVAYVACEGTVIGMASYMTPQVLKSFERSFAEVVWTTEYTNIVLCSFTSRTG